MTSHATHPRKLFVDNFYPEASAFAQRARPVLKHEVSPKKPRKTAGVSEFASCFLAAPAAPGSRAGK